MRVRTGRCESLRSGQARNPQPVEVRNPQDVVDRPSAVSPPAVAVARHVPGRIVRGAQGLEFAVDRPRPPPVPELNGPQAVAACCINRSSTVGIPSSRRLPSGLGIITLRTGLARQLPCISAWRIAGHSVRSIAAVCSTSSLSTPAAPLLALTRFHADALRFVRCDQLTGGLAPPRVRPCRTHQTKQAPNAALVFLVTRRRSRAPGRSDRLIRPRPHHLRPAPPRRPGGRPARRRPSGRCRRRGSPSSGCGCSRPDAPGSAGRARRTA